MSGPDRAYVADGPATGHGIEFHPAVGRETARVALQSGAEFDLNDRPDGPPGGIGATYDDRLGNYHVIQWGVPVPLFSAPLHKENGHLYFGHSRLTQHRPGLFFTADGETLDLRGPAPTFRNIVLRRAG